MSTPETDIRRSAFGELPEQAKRRRDAQHGIYRLLESDLYKRVEGDRDALVMESPLGWRVVFTTTAVGWQTDILDSRGELYKRLMSPTEFDVDRELP